MYMDAKHEKIPCFGLTVLHATLSFHSIKLYPSKSNVNKRKKILFCRKQKIPGITFVCHILWETKLGK